MSGGAIGLIIGLALVLLGFFGTIAHAWRYRDYLPLELRVDLQKAAMGMGTLCFVVGAYALAVWA